MKTGLLLLGLATLSIAPAYAGSKKAWRVYIQRADRYAYGDAFTARSAPDLNSVIGCYAAASDWGSPYIVCQARDSTGNFAYCVSSVPTFVQVGAWSGPNSYYFFRWDADGHCTEIFIDNTSHFGPIQP